MNIRRTSSLLGPLIIVAVGVVLLLNTTGVVSWGTWSDIGKLWPVLVIALGLSTFWRQVKDR